MRHFVAVLSAAGIAIPALADADDVGYQLETSVASTYVSRGVPQYATRTTPSSQTLSALRVDGVAGGSITLSLWTAVAIADHDDQPGTGLELDPSIAYSRTFDRGTIGFGYTTALYPEHLPGTPVDGIHEVSINAQINTPIVSPIAAAYLEVVHQQGAYVTLGGTRDFRLDQLTVSPVATLGFAAYKKYQGAEVEAAPHVNDVTAAVGVRYDLPDDVYLSARLSYSARLTPAELVPEMTGWDLDGRSSLFGAIALGTSR